ncbi:MAG: hypothetical protein O3A01_08135 [bacterium]|nr:hypothetical protein [bacterium]
MQTAFFNLFVSSSGYEVELESCRDVSRDVPGSVSGWWYRDTVTSNADYAEEVVIGDDFGLQLRIGGLAQTELWISDYPEPANETYANPEDITTQHCYQEDDHRGDAYAFMQIDGLEAMKVVVGEGDCPESFPTANAVRYIR